MKTLMRRGVMLAAITAGFALANPQPTHAGNETKGTGNDQTRAGTSDTNPGSMKTGTGNTRTGTDNTTATEADTGRRAATPPADQAPGLTTPADEARVVAKLHLVNQVEIAAGRLAKQKAQSQGVKSYGARLERDHQAADQKILSYAKKRGIDVNAQAPAVESDPDHEKMAATMERLTTLNVAEFDSEFLKAMEEGHRKTIEFVSSAQASIIDPQLKTLLANMLPTLEKHHQIATNLMDRTARTSAAPPDQTEAPSSSQGHRPVDNTRR